jgi:methionine salvage enolase-phosphatase E1
MKKLLQYEVLLNCVLIEEGFRDCFLFWCRYTYKISDYINKLFPTLILNRYAGSNKLLQLKNSDVLLISKRIINPEEYDTDTKLGHLLGYITSTEYEKLDRTLDVYDYVVQVIIEQKEMNLKVNLYNELSNNKICYETNRIKIEESLRKNKLISNQIKEVRVQERFIKSSFLIT